MASSKSKGKRAAAAKIVGKPQAPTRGELCAELRAGPLEDERWKELLALFQKSGTPIDLSGAKLPGVDLNYADLTCLNLDGADLRNVSARRATFPDLKRVKLDGADLSYAYLRGAERCAFRRTTMTSTDLGFDRNEYKKCDFSEAKLDFLGASGCKFIDCRFAKADLSDAALQGSKEGASFPGSDLTGANLSRAQCARSKFAGANLSRAVLFRADLQKASLAKADLRRADLREANLIRADLSGAKIDGADFSGTVLTGAKTAGLNLSRGKNVAPPAPRQARPKLAQLAKIADGSRKFVTTTEVELAKGGYATLTIGYRYYGSAFRYLFANTKYPTGEYDITESEDIDVPNFKQGMLNLARRWAKARLRLNTVQASGCRSPRGKELLELAQAAWSEAFGLDAAAIEAAKAAPAPLDFDTFYQQLRDRIEAGRLSKAAAMLQTEYFNLFADVNDTGLVGIVRSQTARDLVYSCRLGSDGTFACCTQNLKPCGGLLGAPCKHLLVLILGLTKTGQLDPATVNLWLDASRKQKPKIDKDLMSATFLRYKGAEAGEVDWRPTETIPEDYYAL